MKLFLASKLEHTIDTLVQEYFLEPGFTPTVYIPTAQNCDNPPPVLEERSSYIALIQKRFPVTVIDLEQETESTLSMKFENTRLIVVAGGNTYFLLYHMKRSGFTSLLPCLLSSDVIYAGSSAGSCVCSPNIAYIKDQDDPGAALELTDYSALNLIDFDIYPHCIEDWASSSYPNEFVATALKSPDKKIFLRDHQAIVVRDNWYKIV